MSSYIGFVCTTIFHYLHFKSIAEQAGEKAIFVIATPRFTNNRFEKLESYLKSSGAAYCSAHEIITGKVQLDAIVSPYFSPVFNFIDPGIIRIRMLYGYAKDAWNYADWNRAFDLILAYGPYSQRKLQELAPTVSVGHPRYRMNEPQIEVYDLDFRLLTEWEKRDQREILLYCPTWGGLSSFNWFKEAVGLLSREYKIIIKLHHGISLSKEFDLSDLVDDRLFICDETTDLFDLFPRSDLVISDYSGAIFDAMLANKKIVLVNSLSESVADTGLLNIKKMNNIAGVNERSLGVSLDMQMRSVLASVTSPVELRAVVREIIDTPLMDYSTINKDLYSHQDDQAASRAYHAIQEALSIGVVANRSDTAMLISFDLQSFVSYVTENKDHSFVVWGAGDYGQLIVSWLISQGYNVRAILDSNTDKQGELLFDRSIRSPRAYEALSADRIIVAFPVASIRELMPGQELEHNQYIIPFHREEERG